MIMYDKCDSAKCHGTPKHILLITTLYDSLTFQALLTPPIRSYEDTYRNYKHITIVLAIFRMFFSLNLLFAIFLQATVNPRQKQAKWHG